MILIAIFIILVFIFTLFSKRIEKTILTAPMIFSLAGIGIFLLIPDLAEMEMSNETILLIAEITLALLLFTEATHIDLRKLLRETTLPLRLLGIGMPLTILAGTVIAATVLFSIIAHGISALPGTRWYARKIETLDESAPELQDTVSVLPGKVTF